MGSDFHIFIERRVGSDGGQDLWELVENPIVDCDRCMVVNLYLAELQLRPGWIYSDLRSGEPWIPCDVCNPAAADWPRETIWPWAGLGKTHEPLMRSRGILCDKEPVFRSHRSGQQFPVPPLPSLRGIPHDVSAGLAAIAPEGETVMYSSGVGGPFNQTWVLLDELINYDWGTPYTVSELMFPAEYANFMAADVLFTYIRGGPRRFLTRHWSDRLFPHAVQVSNREMEALIAAGEMEEDIPWDGLPTRPMYMTMATWEQTQRDQEAFLYKVVHEQLVPLGAPSDIRLVMWSSW